jgi:epoxyqueuosine reductase
MNLSGNKEISKLIKEHARSIGFDLCGIAQSSPLKDHEQVLNEWLGKGMNADMKYLSENTSQRTNPGLVLDGAKSIIVSGLNYYSRAIAGENEIPMISRYVYGKDYHLVLKERLSLLLDYIVSVIPGVKGKYFVDSAPVLEKAWAHQAGLGWIGRHSILINKKIGSFIFLGVIIIDSELNYDAPLPGDHCGSCRLCIEACPTQAINGNRTIDARKCISWLTIEKKTPVPEEIKEKLGGRIFGCDLCQEVCPWNKNAIPHKNTDFEILPELANMTRADWLSLSREKYSTLFSQSSIGRTKYEKLKRNAEIILKDIN